MLRTGRQHLDISSGSAGPPQTNTLGIDGEGRGNPMRTQAEVEELIQRLFQEIGYDPAELIQIKPKDGVGRTPFPTKSHERMESA